MRAAIHAARFVPRAIALSVALATSLAHAQGSPPALCPANPLAWSSPTDLGVAVRDDVPAAVAAAENGDAMVAWFGPAAAGARVVLTRRYAGLQGALRTWQPATAIKILKAPADPAAVGVSMDAAGHAIAAWETGDHRIEVSRFVRAANGSGQWGAPTILSAAASVASAPVVALRPDGKIGLVFWQTVERNQRALRWASFDTLSGTWSPAATALIDGADEDIAPAVAFTRDGHALLAYQHITGADTATTDRRVRVFGQWFDPSSQAWSRPALLSEALGTVTPLAPPLVPAPRVTLDRDGHGLAVWRYRHPLGGCEQVRAKDFDGASKSWSAATEDFNGCVDPLPGSTLQPRSNVLRAALSPVNTRTTFVLWARNNALGGTPQAIRRASAAAPWDSLLQIPQPAIGGTIEIGDARLAGSAHPSALWVQQRASAWNSGYGLYASNYTTPVTGCQAWSAAAKIADVGRLQPLLRTPDRAAVPLAVWVDRAGETPHVYVSIRRPAIGL